jgi:hypothetical protein
MAQSGDDRRDLEHCAAAAPDLIGGEREHQPSGGGAACQRGHREPAGSGQDGLDQVIDGADVPPGLLRRVVSGLDDIEMNPVCEYVCCSAEDDYPHVAVLGVGVQMPDNVTAQCAFPHSGAQPGSRSSCSTRVEAVHSA